MIGGFLYDTPRRALWRVCGKKPGIFSPNASFTHRPRFPRYWTTVQ